MFVSLFPPPANVRGKNKETNMSDLVLGILVWGSVVLFFLTGLTRSKNPLSGLDPVEVSKIVHDYYEHKDDC
jgi:hypothetical protein